MSRPVPLNRYEQFVIDELRNGATVTLGDNGFWRMQLSPTSQAIGVHADVLKLIAWGYLATAEVDGATVARLVETGVAA